MQSVRSILATRETSIRRQAGVNLYFHKSSFIFLLASNCNKSQLTRDSGWAYAEVDFQAKPYMRSLSQFALLVSIIAPGFAADGARVAGKNIRVELDSAMHT